MRVDCKGTLTIDFGQRLKTLLDKGLLPAAKVGEFSYDQSTGCISSHDMLLHSFGRTSYFNTRTPSIALDYRCKERTSGSGRDVPSSPQPRFIG